VEELIVLKLIAVIIEVYQISLTYKIRFETHLSVLIPCVDIIQGGRFTAIRLMTIILFIYLFILLCVRMIHTRIGY